MFPMVLNKKTNKTMMIMIMMMMMVVMIMMMMMVVVVVSMRMRTVMFWRVRFGSKCLFAGCFACFSVSSDAFHNTAENVQFHSRMKNLRQWSFLRHVSQPDVAEYIVMACIHWTLHWA
jgi:flagellar basal body-associated protein FliL